MGEGGEARAVPMLIKKGSEAEAIETNQSE